MAAAPAASELRAIALADVIFNDAFASRVDHFLGFSTLIESRLWSKSMLRASTHFFLQLRSSNNRVMFSRDRKLKSLSRDGVVRMLVSSLAQEFIPQNVGCATQTSKSGSHAAAPIDLQTGINLVKTFLGHRETLMEEMLAS